MTETEQQHHHHQHQQQQQQKQHHHVVVIVLGDVGRSPRMQYHAVSLLQEGYHVSLVGYHGEELIPALEQELQQQQQQKRFNVVRFTPWSPPIRLRTIVPPIYFLGRVLGLVTSLILVLVTRVSLPVHCVLVQNPPAIPLLFMAYIYCQLVGIFFPNNNNKNNQINRHPPSKRPRLIIDWHNLGYTMLKNGSILQQCAKVYEQTMAPLADGHLCVTKAMKGYLQTEFKLNQTRNTMEENENEEKRIKKKKDDDEATTTSSALTTTNDIISVLYDCPPTLFRPLSLEEQHEFWYRFQQTDSTLQQSCKWIRELLSSSTTTTTSSTIQRTLFTERIIGDQGQQSTVVSRKDRPVLVTSSTSWTEDEDFGILLEALVALETRLVTATTNTSTTTAAANNFRMLVLVTGKGPLKEYYQEQISKLSFQFISIHTVWLAPADYPLLLACADLGISLHTSTSGLDLPMKILDLYGCETPVCALQFNCLSELLQDNVHGKTFTTPQQLATQLHDLLLLQPQQDNLTPALSAPPHSFGALAEYSKNLKGRPRWTANWKQHALPLLKPCHYNNDYNNN